MLLKAPLKKKNPEKEFWKFKKVRVNFLNTVYFFSCVKIKAIQYIQNELVCGLIDWSNNFWWVNYVSKESDIFCMRVCCYRA